MDLTREAFGAMGEVWVSWWLGSRGKSMVNWGFVLIHMSGSYGNRTPRLRLSLGFPFNATKKCNSPPPPPKKRTGPHSIRGPSCLPKARKPYALAAQHSISFETNLSEGCGAPLPPEPCFINDRFLCDNKLVAYANVYVRLARAPPSAYAQKRVMAEFTRRSDGPTQ